MNRFKPLNWFAAGLILLGAGTASAQVNFTQQVALIPSLAGWNSAPACVVDMNNDNLDDIVRLDGSDLVIAFQQTDGTFQQTNFGPVENAGLWSIAAGDIDNNGYTDLVLGDGQRAEFVYANTDGTDYTSDTQPEYIFSQRTTFADIDNDGMLDAFVCHDVDTCHPYHNNGGVLTRDMDLIETAPFRGNYSAMWTDYDNDRDLDLYITKCAGGALPGDTARVNGLYQNDGFGNYTEVGAAANMNDGDQSWTTVIEDFDNDGDMDAFIVNHEVANRFMINNGDGTFTDTIGSTGIDANDLGAWEATCGDFDNNGYMDILSEVEGGLYWNNGDGTFTNENVSFDRGGVGDFNNDGFLDVFNGDAVFLNNTNSNGYLMVSLEGTVSNRDAIGTRVEIFGGWGIQIREVRAGTSFSTHNSHNLHFGLASHTTIDSVVVYWPSGIKETRLGVLANSHIELREGETDNVGMRDDLRNAYTITAFPNPTAGQLTIAVDPQLAISQYDVNLRVYDLNGRMIEQQRVNGQTRIELETAGFAKGAYFVQLVEGVKPVYVEKVLVH